MVGMAIGPVRHRDRARPAPPDQPTTRAICASVPSIRRSGQPQVFAPGRAEHRARRLGFGPPLLRRAVAAHLAARSDRTGRPDRPSAACLATVPPRPISRSSGCGPKTRRSTGSSVVKSQAPNPKSQPLPTAKSQRIPNSQLPTQLPPSRPGATWDLGFGSGWDLEFGSLGFDIDVRNETSTQAASAADRSRSGPGTARQRVDRLPARSVVTTRLTAGDVLGVEQVLRLEEQLDALRVAAAG